MKRLAQIARNVLAGISALLLVATTAIWVRSYRVSNEYLFAFRGEACRASLKSGVVTVDNQPAVAAETFKRQREFWLMSRIGGDEGAGSLFINVPTRVPSLWSHFTVSLAPLLVGLFAIVPTWRLREKWILRYRRRSGQCVSCGYDMRASRDRCPECGLFL